jgi:hypothetical protein
MWLALPVCALHRAAKGLQRDPAAANLARSVPHATRHTPHAAHLGSRGSDCGWQADQRVIAAEAHVPMLEAAAKQAHARAVSEAAARELLQARAEASEKRLGRLEAANHLLLHQNTKAAPRTGRTQRVAPPPVPPPAPLSPVDAPLPVVHVAQSPFTERT